jgi:hypothetical protein
MSSEHSIIAGSRAIPGAMSTNMAGASLLSFKPASQVASLLLFLKPAMHAVVRPNVVSTQKAYQSTCKPASQVAILSFWKTASQVARPRAVFLFFKPATKLQIPRLTERQSKHLYVSLLGSKSFLLPASLPGSLPSLLQASLPGSVPSLL